MPYGPFPHETRLTDFLAALASADDGYNAVSAAAFAAAMGTSLLVMVASLPKTKSDSTEEREALVTSATALRGLQEQLVETIETQTAVTLFVARAMPHGNRAQRTERDAAIQLALRAAADVPLELMRLSATALTHAETIATCSCQAASTDVQLAVALLRVGVEGSRTNLEMKLTSLTDVLYTASVVDEISRLSEEATTTARAAEALVQLPPA